MSELGYGTAAQRYWQAGFKGILPLPHGAKYPPPTDTTGYKGFYPAWPDIQAWTEDFQDGNLGLRLPNTLMGLDVDAYPGKSGAATLAHAESLWGPLPPAVRSTSRIDGVSGIRLFRIPAGVELETVVKFDLGDGKVLADIEVIQYFHRYVVAWPSLHSGTGRRYHWLNAAGDVTADIPRPIHQPDLPAAWVEGLRRKPQAELTAEGDATKVLESLSSGPMSPGVQMTLSRGLTGLSAGGGSRHDAVRDVVLALFRLHEKGGETGIREALEQLGRAFISATTKDGSRSLDSARSEWDRMVRGQRGHDLIASTPSVPSLADLLGKQPVQPAPPPQPTPTPAQRPDHDEARREWDAKYNARPVHDHDLDPSCPEFDTGTGGRIGRCLSRPGIPGSSGWTDRHNHSIAENPHCREYQPFGGRMTGVCWRGTALDAEELPQMIGRRLSPEELEQVYAEAERLGIKITRIDTGNHALEQPSGNSGDFDSVLLAEAVQPEQPFGNSEDFDDPLDWFFNDDQTPDDFDLVLLVPEEEVGAAPEGSRTSWGPVDIAVILSGDLTPERPTVCRRTDGRAIFYKGHVNALVGESESGKAQPLSAKVATPTGWTTIGELEVGSVILGSDGLPQGVTAVYDRGIREVWEVVTGCGVVIECCEDHLWAASNANDRSRGNPLRVMTTREISKSVRLNSGSPQWSIPMPDPAVYEPRGALPLDPYLLGLLLGDGGLTKGITFTNPDIGLHEQMDSRLFGGVTRRTSMGSRCHTSSLTRGRTGGLANPMMDALRELGLFGRKGIEKFIPECYLLASVSDRLDILHGLMDTDGGSENGGRSSLFNTSSPMLAQQVGELVQSLGGTAAISCKSEPRYQSGIGQPAYRVRIRLPEGMKPFRFSSAKLDKFNAAAPGRRPPSNRIADVRQTGRFEEMRCISVSNSDQLYRTAGHTLTHNSWVAQMACEQELSAGEAVAYLDFEDTPHGLAARMLALGVDRGSLIDRLFYIAPDSPIGPIEKEELYSTLDIAQPTVIVVDGVNAAMTLLGLDLEKNTDATQFFQLILKPLAMTGAAVITIDHVTKAQETRGNYAIGAQAKRAMIDGAMIGVKCIERFGRGRLGELELAALKDRLGGVREIAEKRGRSLDYIGNVVIDARTEDRVLMTFTFREESKNENGIPAEQQALIVKMYEVSQFLEKNDREKKGLSQNYLATTVPGRNKDVIAALNALVDLGHVQRLDGPRGSKIHILVRGYHGPDDDGIQALLMG